MLGRQCKDSLLPGHSCFGGLPQSETALSYDRSRILHERVASKLDEGLDDLPPGTLYRLRLAREAALSRLHAEQAGDVPRRPLFALAQPHGSDPCVRADPRAVRPISSGNNKRLTRPDGAELDAQVLSEELPVTAYLDQGFETWLYHHSTE